MSQVFNGTKMMFDGCASPAARVEGKIYFVDELLQECSGSYFIPEHFFYASYPSSAVTEESGLDRMAIHEIELDSEPASSHRQKELYALGREVKRTDVSCLVNWSLKCC